MTYTQETFRQFCHEAAKQFLQTVVVIDNEAIYDEKSEVEEKSQPQATRVMLKEPSKGMLSALKTVSHAEDSLTSASEVKPLAQENAPESSEKKFSPDSRNLRAKALIDGFADDGIICSVIRPDADESKVIQRAVTVALAADIVVVDWMLGNKEGESPSLRAREIIKGIIDGDLEKRGRLRLIAIYTAEGPAGVLDALYDHIKGLKFPHDGIRKDEGTLSIQNSHLKIVVFNKPSVAESPKTRPVKFEDLPSELLKLFSDLNVGLLPTVALRSIAAIREETHHLLAVLHGKLDPALVGHRCLLEAPDDAEEFCEDLVAGELRGILSTRGIGRNYLNLKANKKWIGSLIKKDEYLYYDKKFRFSRDHAHLLLENGQKEHKIVFSQIRADWLERKVGEDKDYKDNKDSPINLKDAKERLLSGDALAVTQYKIPAISEKDLPQIFDGSKDSGEKINYEFSRLCTLKREAYGLRRPFQDWVPHLTLGTILQQKETDKYFICLQPRCDSVRLTKEQNYRFPFLAIGEGKKKGYLVVRGLDATSKIVDKELTYEPLPRHQVIFEFKCDDRKGIIAEEKNGHFVFTESTKQEGQPGQEYYWIADIKDFIAQKIADDLSTRIGSVGLDEYEWLRRKAK